MNKIHWSKASLSVLNNVRTGLQLTLVSPLVFYSFHCGYMPRVDRWPRMNIPPTKRPPPPRLNKPQNTAESESSHRILVCGGGTYSTVIFTLRWLVCLKQNKWWHYIQLHKNYTKLQLGLIQQIVENVLYLYKIPTEFLQLWKIKTQKLENKQENCTVFSCLFNEDKYPFSSPIIVHYGRTVLLFLISGLLCLIKIETSPQQYGVLTGSFW